MLSSPTLLAAAAPIAASQLLAHPVNLTIGVLGAFGILYAARIVARGKTAERALAATAEAQTTAAEWRDNYLAERQRAEDALKLADEQRSLKHQARNEALALRMQTDLTPVMTALLDLQKGSSRQIEILQQIADHLPS